MPVQRSQKRRRPMVPRANEMPKGVQAIAQAEARNERRPDGTFDRGARTAQSKGGRSLKNRTALSHEAGLSSLGALEEVKPYLDQAKPYARKLCADYAASFGGGYCGPGPASVISSAALQLAM